MIDLRKNNKTELNEKVLEFIELLENDGAKVEIKKVIILQRL